MAAPTFGINCLYPPLRPTNPAGPFAAMTAFDEGAFVSHSFTRHNNIPNNDGILIWLFYLLLMDKK